MKNLEENKLEIKALLKEEVEEIDGGHPIIPYIIGGLVYVTKKCIDDWDNFKNGLMGEPEQ